jgi:hypothetical protein
MKGEKPTLQMNMTINETAIKPEYFTMGSFHKQGLGESSQSLGEVGFTLIIIIPIREERS